MASILTFRVSPYFGLDSECKSRCRVKVRSLSSGDSVFVSGASFVGEKESIGSISTGGENGQVGSKVEEKKKVKDVVSEQLEALYDDGFGTQSVKDYMDIAKEMIKPDGGPPRWFCPVECGRPLKDSPILLFLPGMEGVGLGLILHHKPLGKAFEVRCLHIPVYDRTPFEGLVKFVEETVKSEHASSPNKPIYLVGDSFGGCLALAVAARNPMIDLLVILANPATSFGKSQLQPSFPILEAFPKELHFTIPYLFSFIMGDPMKMAMVNVDSSRSPALVLEQLSSNLIALLPRLSGLAKIIPKDTLLWKLKLLKSAAAYANSRLHAVKAEVLVLASGKDNMLPSEDEAQRLSSSLHNCRVRYFKDNGHTLLLEDGINLMTVIKGTSLYRRRSRRHDFISDFLPPSMSEFISTFSQQPGFRFATSPVMFSTLKDGKMVKGLAGVPTEGPVLLVGYHNLLGVELHSVVEAFLREKNVLVRGLAHPTIFTGEFERSSNADFVRVFGALPVTPSNLFKLFTAKSHVLLYPGGAREALHNKGEEYKLFWPDQPEFVRMAARFGATIVPFGAVGEDDIVELVLDYNDMMRIPMLNDMITESNRNSVKVRDNVEIDNQQLFLPGIFPKIPGRLYYLFGKPIETKGREEILKDKESANKLYLQIKSEVERILAYLIRKREEDPYRGIIDRTVYRAIYAPPDEVPTFEP